jgi:cytidylate kinase
MSDMPQLLITIDGPAGSGKSTVARLLAEQLHASFLDTGAMYRAVALAAMQSKADLTSQDALLEVLDRTRFTFACGQDGMLVRINNVDVTEQLRRPQVTADARYVAAAPRVRSRLVEMQRNYAASHARIVCEGRDQGTAAFPEANVKFFLTADLAERARRRQPELEQKGIQQSLDEIKRSIDDRDKSDRTRLIGPLRPADDAIIINTTNLTVSEVVQQLVGWVRKKCSKI